jgi:predicted dehydrogenase
MTEDQACLLRTGVKQALRTSERNSIQTGWERESGRTTIYDENQSGSTAVVSDFRGHQAVVEDFFPSHQAKSRSACDGLEGRRSIALIEAIYRAAKTPDRVATV